MLLFMNKINWEHKSTTPKHGKNYLIHIYQRKFCIDQVGLIHSWSYSSLQLWFAKLTCRVWAAICLCRMVATRFPVLQHHWGKITFIFLNLYQCQSLSSIRGCRETHRAFWTSRDSATWAGAHQFENHSSMIVIVWSWNEELKALQMHF